MANYPYDERNPNKKHAGSHYSKTPDDDVFIAISKAYSEAHKKMHTGRPCPERERSYFEVSIVLQLHYRVKQNEKSDHAEA